MDDSTEPTPHTDHVHHEYTPLHIETHYGENICCFVLWLFFAIVCLGVVALLFYFFFGVLGITEGEFVGYLAGLPFCGFFFCGWRVGVHVYRYYKDLKKEGKRIVCLNVPKNRIALIHVICSCYSQKEIISPLSRIIKFKYYNNESTNVQITRGDNEMFYSEVEGGIPVFKVRQMIETLQRCNPEIVIEGPANSGNNADPTILYDADTVTSDASTAHSPPPSAFPTSSSSSSYNNSSELHTDAELENGNKNGNGNGNSSFLAGTQGLGQDTPLLAPYLLSSSALASVSAASSATASASSSTFEGVDTIMNGE